MKFKYESTFGMFEMERAAERIIAVLREKDRNAGIEDMEGEQEQIGYLELLYNGWLYHGTYNGQFYPKQSFFKRLGEEPPAWWKNVPISDEE